MGASNAGGVGGVYEKSRFSTSISLYRIRFLIHIAVSCRPIISEIK